MARRINHRLVLAGWAAWMTMVIGGASAKECVVPAPSNEISVVSQGRTLPTGPCLVVVQDQCPLAVLSTGSAPWGPALRLERASPRHGEIRGAALDLVALLKAGNLRKHFSVWLAQAEVRGPASSSCSINVLQCTWLT